MKAKKMTKAKKEELKQTRVSGKVLLFEAALLTAVIRAELLAGNLDSVGRRIEFLHEFLKKGATK